MLFIKLENNNPVGYRIIEENIRQVIPELRNKAITVDNIAPYDYGIMEISIFTSVEKYEVAEESEIMLQDSGIYTQTYSVRQMTTDEILEKDENQKRIERDNRDFLLRLNIDSLNPIRWNEMDESQQIVWTGYRNNLLNVPQQEGFPWDIEWPPLPIT
tara:strand:+ start:1261 stop:1734 length:474 start_codon:yes stop_codon:yes gene_type:complete